MARIPHDGEYKGVPIFAGQSERRLKIVRQHIDAVCEMGDVRELVSACRDQSMAAEARLWAFARIRTICEQAQDERRVLPRGVDLEELQAWVGHFNTEWHTIIEPPWPPRDKDGDE